MMLINWYDGNPDKQVVMYWSKGIYYERVMGEVVT